MRGEFLILVPFFVLLGGMLLSMVFKKVLPSTVVKFANGQFGVRRWSLWPFHYEYLNSGSGSKVLEFHWWQDVGGISPEQYSIGFPSRESAEAKLRRYEAYRDTPASNDPGTPV